MKNYSIIFSILVLLCFTTNAHSQCRAFAEAESKQQLTPFLHDGIYNAVELSEGESTELYKTFYANQSYRIALCAEAQLPKIKLTVMDSERNVLFCNADKNYATVWDFNSQAVQQLIIAIDVETNDDKVSDEIASGCVALLIGYKKFSY